MREHVNVDRAPASAFGLSDELDPFDADWHAHAKHQLLYATHGTMRLEAAGAQWILPPQRAAWIGAGVRHRVMASGPVSLRTVYLAPSLVPAELPETGVFNVTPLAREMVLHAMRWGPDPSAADEVSSRFFSALAALCTEWTRAPLPLKLPTPKTPELAAAMEFVLARMTRPISVADAARAAGVSPRTLARRFEEEAGMGFRQFLLTARMMKAMELLAIPGARIRQTAHAVGFDSEAAFTRAFRAFAGDRPVDFRERAVGKRGNAGQVSGRTGKGR